MTPHLAADIERDEGRRRNAYRDTVGIWTVGVGHARVPAGTVWTDDEIDRVLASDIADVIASLDKRLPWWRTLDDARQDVLVNMAFNLGVAGLLGFKNSLADIQAGQFESAAKRMLQSRWSKQVGARATRLAAQMRTGVRV
ncbi:MAG: glycoside hydrolase family protein [Myxococcales bacterium]